MDDESFLRNAMERYGSSVYRLALCRLQSPADAEDVYQDVFLRLLSQKERDWDNEYLKAWLLRTALNRCTDFLRFRLRRPVLSLDEIPEMAEPVDEQSAALWDAVARLPDKLRTVFHLYYGEGYSTDEIAGLLHCSGAAIRSRLHRGRKQLKIMLGGMDHESVSNSVELHSNANKSGTARARRGEAEAVSPELEARFSGCRLRGSGIGPNAKFLDYEHSPDC